MVLRRQAGVCKILRYSRPFAQASVVEHLQFVGDDERYNAVTEAFLEHYKTPYAPVAVLKRMDGLKPVVEIQYVFKGNGSLAAVLLQQCTDGSSCLFGRDGLYSSHLIGQALVVSYREP